MARRSLHHLDSVTEKWHQKLHRKIDEDIYRLKTTRNKFFFSTTVHHYTTTNPRDREAMVALYNTTNGHYWNNSTRWMKGTPAMMNGMAFTVMLGVYFRST